LSKTYIKKIGEKVFTIDSYQTSPHWVVTFTRFNTRDTKNYKKLGPNSSEPVRRPLVVENDCISVNVSSSKTNTTPSATIVLTSGDLNYATAVSPGDFVMINMVNFPDKARDIRNRAVNRKPINKEGDGFKGVFKINSVNKIMQADPSSGQKVLRYQVTAYAFTEFNNMIYYNPTLGDGALKNTLIYQINTTLNEILNSKLNIQRVLEILPKIIIGNGSVNATSDVFSTKKEPYQIPGTVFDLLGMKGTVAADLYKQMVGVWDNNGQLDPSYKEQGSTQKLNTHLQGLIPIQTSPLTNVTLIDLLKRYSNEMINEIYTCFRLDSKRKSVIPKLIIRQKPFNTEHGKVAGTKFLSLPRWQLDADSIYSLNVSKNESLRFNFVHIIGTTGQSNVDSANLANANSNQNNIRYDNEDIRRHGLRPYTKVSNFDWPIDGGSSYTPYWTSLVWDWVYGGQLRLNGTVSCVGIEEDICIGDNLEIGDTVYHIEAVNHTASIDPNGIKSFRTDLKLTHGTDKRSSSKGPVYPEMDFTDTKTDREYDYNSNIDILPGFSDTQDVVGRDNGEEKNETKERSYTPNGIKKKL
jgi:hypothetical protein